ncbi:MAG TPA: hypothetical protein VK666_26295, partial [Chryseolinea sp.]|nr:hypothetical protein [Chryseolinea sp.]
MKFKFRFVAISLVTATFLAGCTDNPTVNGGDSLPDDTIDVQNLKVKGQNFMMPSPLQIADMIKKSGSLYDKQMLNSTDNLSKYT